MLDLPALRHIPTLPPPEFPRTSQKTACPRSGAIKRLRPRALSLALDVRGLDDRPPFLNFGALVRAKSRGCLLRARRQLEAKIGETRSYRRVGQSLHGRTIEP